MQPLCTIMGMKPAQWLLFVGQGHNGQQFAKPPDLHLQFAQFGANPGMHPAGTQWAQCGCNVPTMPMQWAQPSPHACQCPAIAPSARSGLQAPQSGVMHPQWAQCPSWAQCAQCSCNAAKWAAAPRNAPKPVQCPQCPCKPHHARHGKPAGAV